jgi:hypothetical protein
MMRIILVSVHGHALTVPAKFTVGRGRDGARRVTADSRALLEGQQLLGAERLVVDLCGGLDEVLQVGAGEEVAEVYEFAVGLVLDCKGLVIECLVESGYRTIDDTPLVLATANVPTVHDNSSL